MPSFTLVSPTGERTLLEGTDGQSVMQVSVAQGVHGIVGECGGSAMCATCHVYVDADWIEQLPPVSAPEAEMLECTASERRPESRLSCQIKLNSHLDGLVLHLPETQQ